MPIQIGRPLTPGEMEEHLQFLAIFRQVLESRAKLLAELEEQAWSPADQEAPADEDHPSR